MKRITKALEICSAGLSLHHDTCAASQIFENSFPMDRFKGFVVGNQGFYAKSIDSIDLLGFQDFKGDFSLQIDRWPNLPCSSFLEASSEVPGRSHGTPPAAWKVTLVTSVSDGW